MRRGLRARRGAGRMTYSLALLIAAGLVAGILSMPALANHPNIYCDGGSGGFNNNQKRNLAYYFINWSYWGSSGDYIATREDSSFNETFRQFQVGGVNTQTNTSDGLDAFRSTIIQRAGYAFATWGMDELSHDGCFS